MAGCGSKREPQPTPTGSATPVAATSAADGRAADPATGPIELLHAIPTTVRVSSRVHNKAITPEHLVDGDLGTAWNSLTGELVGAWIEVTLPAGARARELRMTIGHTGHGPKGEDYFTMNPRIASASVTRDGAPLVQHRFEPAQRTLQAIVLPDGAGGTLRVRVDEIVAGSRARWREICVSELEVWGDPPPGTKLPAKPLAPTVLVGEPIVVDTSATVASTDQLCEQQLAPARERYRTAMAQIEREEAACTHNPSSTGEPCGDPDPPGEPACDVTPGTIAGAVAPWTGVGVMCHVPDSVYGPKQCALVLGIDGSWRTGPGIEGPALAPSNTHWAITLDQVDIANATGGGSHNLVVRYSISDTDNHYLIACRAKPALACTPAFQIAGTGWTVTAKFDRGDLVLNADSGAPPPDVIGRYPVRFSGGP
jgi:hypothetical protein